MKVRSYCSLGVSHDGWEKIAIELDDGTVVRKDYRCTERPWKNHFGFEIPAGAKAPPKNRALARAVHK